MWLWDPSRRDGCCRNSRRQRRVPDIALSGVDGTQKKKESSFNIEI